MKILSIQEAYSKKFERQKQIKELEYHAAGHCAHIGKLSPGCKSCFVPIKDDHINLCAGVECNLKCSYCLCSGDRVHSRTTFTKDKKNKIALKVLSHKHQISVVSFTGGGEPLLYMDVIAKYVGFFHSLEQYMKKKPWYYLYTNGLLANDINLQKLIDLGFEEIRFHLGASNFSKVAYRNLEKAVRYFKVVSIETPSWPPHRKKLFEMLPIINDIGIRHLNIGEIEINLNNIKNIGRILPKAEVYHCFGLHLYDGGLVYDIIEEVLKRKHSYSVIDCNSFVKSIQRGAAKYVYHEKVENLCAKY